MNEEIKELLFLLHNDRLTEAGKRKLEQEIERLSNIIKEQGMENKPNYYLKGLEGSLKEYQEEVEKLNSTIFNLNKRNSHQRIANSDMQEALKKANKKTSKYAQRCLSALNYIKSRNAVLGDKRLMNILLGVEEDWAKEQK